MPKIASKIILNFQNSSSLSTVEGGDKLGSSKL